MPSSGFHPFKGRVSKHIGDQLSPDDTYLSYHDVRLTKEDIDMLKNDWLTDNNIAFWEEYLEREKLSQYPNTSVVLLRPSMSFMLMQTPDPHTLKDALPNFSKTTHIFMPINDCRNVEIPEGGSHWSLLLVSLVDGVAFHYDSLALSNFNEARLATEKIGQLLERRLEFMHLYDTPQQQNSSDCGVFVCIEMKHLLLKKILRASPNERVNMALAGNLVDASKGRKKMMKIIDDFRKEAEKRRSNAASLSNASESTSKNPPRID